MSAQTADAALVMLRDVRDLLCQEGRDLKPQFFVDGVALIILTYAGKDQRMTIPRGVESANASAQRDEHETTKVDDDEDDDEDDVDEEYRGDASEEEEDDEKSNQKARQRQSLAAAANLNRIAIMFSANVSRFRSAPVPIAVCERGERGKRTHPYVLNADVRWEKVEECLVSPAGLVRDDGREVKAAEKLIGAALIADKTGEALVCVYGTTSGLYFNAKDGTATALIEERILAVWRQEEQVLVATLHPKVYAVSLPSAGEPPTLEVVFETRSSHVKHFEFDKSVGCFYNGGRQRFYVATSYGRIFCLRHEKNQDRVFAQRLHDFRVAQLEDQRQRNAAANQKQFERGAFFYADTDQGFLTLFGRKFITRIPMDHGKKNEFAHVVPVDAVLPSLSFDAIHFLYDYAMKSIIVLSRISQSGKVPFRLNVFTGESLRFENTIKKLREDGKS